MTQDRTILIRNMFAGVLLLIVTIVVLIWLGVFEGTESEDAQIRNLLEDSRMHINDHDWDDFYDQCDLTDDERKKWVAAVPMQANYLNLDTLSPTSFISVPEGATEYQIEVQYIARLVIPGARLRPESAKATYYFVKKDNQWWIDIKRTVESVPYISEPK